MDWQIRIFPFVIFFLVSSLSSLYAHPLSTSVNTSSSTALGLVLGGMDEPPPPSMFIILKGSAVMGTGSPLASATIPAAATVFIRGPGLTPESLVNGQGQSVGNGGGRTANRSNPGDGTGPATGEFDGDEWKLTVGAGYLNDFSDLKLRAGYRYSDTDDLGNGSGGEGENGSGGQGTNGSGVNGPLVGEADLEQWRSSLNLGGLKSTEVLRGPEGAVFGSTKVADLINVTVGAGGNDRSIPVPPQLLFGRQVLDFGEVRIPDFPFFIMIFQTYANPWNLGAEFTRKTDIGLGWQTEISRFGTFGDFQESPQVKSRFEAFAGAAILDIELNALIIIAPAPGLDPSTWPDTEASPVAQAHLPKSQLSFEGDS